MWISMGGGTDIMLYRARNSTAPSAWISDDRGRFSFGGKLNCASFFRYKGVAGCPQWANGNPCGYCFLRTTFARAPDLRAGVAWGSLLADCEDCHRQEDDGSCRAAGCAVPIDVSPARAAVGKWLRETGAELCGGGGCNDMACHGCDPRVLNAGELCDSFGFREEENPHLGMLLGLFGSAESNPYGHLLLLVTKQGVTGGPWGPGVAHHLVGRPPSANVILSFSMGNRVWEEDGCAPVMESGGRLEAALWARKAGWRVRWRLDPLSYANPESPSHPGIWCRALAERAAAADALPELVTLGQLRKHAQPIGSSLQARVWPLAIGALRKAGYQGPIGFCKEPPGAASEYLGMPAEEMRCNCLP